jgi:RND family efflux transporter MFP subunit
MAVEQSEPLSNIQATASPAPPQGARAARAEAEPRSRAVWRGLLAGFLVIVVAAVGAYFYFHQGDPTGAAEDPDAREAAARQAEPLVEVVRPVSGGIVRETTQPGTLHAFQAANLFAKVSGYLTALNVDIGDRVKEGQVLAEIDDPEIHKAVDQAEAALKQAQAAVTQAEAQVDTAEADLLTAKAEHTRVEADVKEATAQRVYRQSEYERYQDLLRRGSIERKLVDEEKERHASAVAAEEAAKAAVEASTAKIAAADARVESSKADLEAAHANVGVSQADLEKAKVLAAYTVIKAPFDGVITNRNFFVGDFIRSAPEGESKPLLAMAKTDKLRVVVRIPDRDVPFVDTRDTAEITIDALPGETFRGKVARFAESEDPSDRTMRTEIDLPNDGGKLREGMYGNVTIVLDPASRGAVTVPASALIHQDGGGNGEVYLVKEGKVELRHVTIGKDNGKSVEVLEGLTTGDMVVVRYSGSISEGLAVRTELARSAEATAKAE